MDIKGKEARRKRMAVLRLRATRTVDHRSFHSCYSMPKMVAMTNCCFQKRAAEDGRGRFNSRPMRLQKKEDEEEAEDAETSIHHICFKMNGAAVPCLCAQLCAPPNHPPYKEEDTPKSAVADACDDVSALEDERQRMYEKLFGSDEYSSHSGDTTSADDTDGVKLSVAAKPKKKKRKKKSTATRGREETPHGWVEVCGRRREMEDAVMVVQGLDFGGGDRRFHFFGVYDGHGGSQAARVCKETLHRVLAEEVERGDAVELYSRGNEGGWGRVMRLCFTRVDAEVERITQLSGGGAGGGGKGGERTVGSTAVVALVSQHQIVVANCGDSRAVLARAGTAVPLSVDHKPDRPDEMGRVESAGGRVINCDGYRVLGVLATSRAIGDRYLKPFVISEPEVTVSERTSHDEFLVLASDGLWDVMSNDMVCRITRKCLSGSATKRRMAVDRGAVASEAAVAATVLTELALNRGSDDNISVVIVDLRQCRRNEPGTNYDV